ncbi:metal-independent phosphoserine phosphatase-like [Magnolia sinica]|uniref:metal-independent phosphoserine phosphatase-like n=1 Tax=Magnolia sinica TaxID=86752 RepID=UPI0026592C79|nr:metal-independent phosphoserine phosphatase-like [Magnolia sinica]
MATCLVSSNEGTINAMVAITSENECAAEILHDVAEIVMVRHGETTWNASGRIQGQLESELNEVGWKQAAAIAERLGKESKPTAVYSSELKRAKNTAEMIAKNCHIHEVIEIPELKERHVGSLQGLVWGEIEEKEPEAYHAFFSSQNDLEIPGGGESFNQLCERSVGALEELASRHKGERVIVVTHGGVLRAIYMSLTREPTAGKVLNASINVLHLSEKKWAFKSWSDVAHLNEVGFLQRGFNGDTLPQP